MRTHSATTGADEFHRIEVITGVGHRRRWTLEEKARIVAESLAPATTDHVCCFPLRGWQEQRVR